MQACFIVPVVPAEFAAGGASSSHQFAEMDTGEVSRMKIEAGESEAEAAMVVASLQTFARMLPGCFRCDASKQTRRANALPATRQKTSSTRCTRKSVFWAAVRIVEGSLRSGSRK